MQLNLELGITLSFKFIPITSFCSLLLIFHKDTVYFLASCMYHCPVLSFNNDLLLSNLHSLYALTIFWLYFSLLMCLFFHCPLLGLDDLI